jgi:hypothetical protein|tara:strand:+ start:94 stop:486 length:393 start_codon:yes stop_codon:yes gene_type:complete
MAYKIVTPNEKNLTQILNNIELWFNSTLDFKVNFTEEMRKFFDPETKQIEERSINVIEVEEYGTSKRAKVKFIPLLIPTEMKVEINGEGEFAIKNRINNQMKKLGTLKSYNRDTLKPKTVKTDKFVLSNV